MYIQAALCEPTMQGEDAVIGEVFTKVWMFPHLLGTGYEITDELQLGGLVIYLPNY